MFFRQLIFGFEPLKYELSERMLYSIINVFYAEICDEIFFIVEWFAATLADCFARPVVFVGRLFLGGAINGDCC